jgi:hypothetical protein
VHRDLRERGVVHEPDILEPVERRADRIVRYPSLA